MEPVILDTKDNRVVNIFKFAVLQKMAIEYFDFIIEPLEENFQMQLSTMYKHRFTANSKEKKRLRR